MSIRKVVAGLLITAGIAIMAVSFFWCTTGERNTNQVKDRISRSLEYDRERRNDRLWQKTLKTTHIYKKDVRFY